MRNQLVNSVDRGQVLEMMYMDKIRVMSKRRIRVLQVGEGSFWAYCYLRKSKRTFRIDNVLVLVPVYQKESRMI